MRNAELQSSGLRIGNSAFRNPLSAFRFPLSAFTLIELILALALSAVLLALLAAALNMGIARATGSRDAVEQARLVDGVIALITSDIQNAALYDPQDVSSAMSIAEASAEFDVDSIDSISDIGPGGGSGEDSSSSFDSTSEAESLRRPLGITGTLHELRLDVLRERPQHKVDESGAVTATTSNGAVTTVLYQIGEGRASLSRTVNGSSQTTHSGLTRHEVHRDLLDWAEQTGGASEAVGQPLLIATEVSRIEFRYFDGVEVWEEWNSELREGELPRAIELRLWFVKTNGLQETTTSEAKESLPFVMTIALPTAWNLAEAAPAQTDAETSSTDDNGSTDSTGSTGSTGGSR